VPGNNRYFRPILAPRKGRTPTAAQQARLIEAGRLIRADAWTDAEATLRPLLDELPESAEAQCYLALCAAHRGDFDEALQSITRAAECGWGNWRFWQENKSFASLRDRKEFKEAVEKSKAVVMDVAPAIGFRSATNWNVRGEPDAPDKGRRYLLSVMLAVTSGRGNSVPEALGALRAGFAANGSCPKGAFYFMRNENIRSTIRDWLFPSVVEKLRSMGLAAEVDEGIVPWAKPDVMGAAIGAAEYDWKASGSRILPGAICEDLTSSGGILTAGAGQTPLTSLIASGAAGSSGTVTEPIAIEEKFPCPFIHVHYACGCSLAEAFYQSVATPYQLLIVGDPLCAPWRVAPAVVVGGLADGQIVRGTFVVKPAAPLSSAPVEQFELFMDGQRRGRVLPGRRAGADASRMLEGYHELRVVAVSGGPIEERSTTIVPFVINRGGGPPVISEPEQSEVPWDRPLRLRAERAGAAEIQFLHNLRPIGVIHGEKGDVEVNPQILGQGLCRVQCVALDAGKNRIAASRFIELRVIPPAPSAAIEPPAEGLIEKGLLLTAERSNSAALTDTRRKDWLNAAGVREGQSFTLEGYFEAPEEDVYQFQVCGNVSPVLEVDSRTLRSPEAIPTQASEEGGPEIVVSPPGSAAWAFLPVSLAKGLHRLRVTGVGVKNPTLDIRFGGRGTQSIGGDFRHAKPPAAAPEGAP
jgi:hypothetical protein